MHDGMLYITFWKNRSMLFSYSFTYHLSVLFCPFLSLAGFLTYSLHYCFPFFCLQVACMQFINALVTSPDELDLRLHIRNEYMRCGLKEILPVRFDTHTHATKIKLTLVHLVMRFNKLSTSVK